MNRFCACMSANVPLSNQPWSRICNLQSSSEPFEHVDVHIVQAIFRAALSLSLSKNPLDCTPGLIPHSRSFASSCLKFVLLACWSTFVALKFRSKLFQIFSNFKIHPIIGPSTFRRRVPGWKRANCHRILHNQNAMKAEQARWLPLSGDFGIRWALLINSGKAAGKEKKSCCATAVQMLFKFLFDSQKWLTEFLFTLNKDDETAPSSVFASRFFLCLH